MWNTLISRSKMIGPYDFDIMRFFYFLIHFICNIIDINKLTATSDNFYQLLAHGRWFSPLQKITGRLALSQQSSRFTLPMDMKELESKLNY
jgi:hypothetical protein